MIVLYPSPGLNPARPGPSKSSARDFWVWRDVRSDLYPFIIVVTIRQVQVPSGFLFRSTKTDASSPASSPLSSAKCATLESGDGAAVSSAPAMALRIGDMRWSRRQSWPGHAPAADADRARHGRLGHLRVGSKVEGRLAINFIDEPKEAAAEGAVAGVLRPRARGVLRTVCRARRSQRRG